jgi:hypothetical protein
MLPGFRFLFAAIVLCMSILVFGLGATALMRAAHEQFASNPSWRPPHETVFAQPNDAARPVLAVLRTEPPAQTVGQTAVDPQAVDPQAVDPQAFAAPADTPATSAPAEPEAVVPAMPEPEKIAAVAAAESSPASPSPGSVNAPAAPAEISAAAPPVPAEAATNEAPATSGPTVAATEQPSPPASVRAPEASDSGDTPAPRLYSADIAAIGDPPAKVETPRPQQTKNAEPDRDDIRRRLRARRARERHRLAARRAWLARQAAGSQQQGAIAFGQQPPATSSPSGGI